MYWQMAKRVLFEADKRQLVNLAWKLGFKGARSVSLHKKRMKKGVFFPPFLYISVISSCNLRCQGCWVDVTAPRKMISLEHLKKIVKEAKEMGNRFFGILGGEPFLHPQIMDLFEAFPECYFQIFTNGHFITSDVAKRLAKCGNVSPLISIEGLELSSDVRRGSQSVFEKSWRGFENCVSAGLVTGVCASLCKTNLDELLSENWVDRLIEAGAFYLWYHTYRPVGPAPSEELALGPDEQQRIREFVVNTRSRKPIGVIDAYYDGNGDALCPAVTGISHHINPSGDVEPCPIIQFTKESAVGEKPLKEVFTQSAFLKDFREVVATKTRGCVVLERPDILKALVDKHGAADASIRQKAMEELEKMKSRPSQEKMLVKIPEKNIIYKFAKKMWYSDFGSYKNLEK